MNDTEKELKTMPIMEHLIELRKRLLYSVIILLLFFMIGFYFADHIYNFLAAPLADIWKNEESRGMIATALHEQFFTHIKVAFFAALMVAFPLISLQIWAFIAPALYKNEKKAFLPFLIATPVLFAMGASFVYYLVLPVAWEFFTSFEQIAAAGQLSIEIQPKVSEYLSLVMTLIFAFGISFEIPVALSLLARAGIVSAQSLKEKRRYAIVIAFVAAAILTPPDPISQIGLAIPIILLYEISIICAKIIEKSKKEAEDKERAANYQ